MRISRVLPILFKTDMVRAILDGRKTVTRRVLKHPFEVHPNGFITKPRGSERLCPYDPPYQPGDILYVRETWNYVYDMDENDQIIEGTGRYIYYSDDPMPFSHWVDTDTGEHKEQMHWRPSIHMPKEAARIWLKVTDVRVERLQDITEEQAKAEGFSCREEFIKTFFKMYPDCTEESWLWVIEFERCEKPESEG